MKLSEEQEVICKVFSRRGKDGLVHCCDCPMKLSRRYAVCLKNISKKDARENWDWDGSPYPAINGLNVEER